mmetsp:Transcript_21235/g.51308  ORF Transcript_21235/g.51308 Transcript_21235/m.51308 type:complete len:322 (-) Transcript_21235:357-1322(-)|eukprot:CAMPEP_0181122030 /NCGR_PEP_ID=MMETSP1071-20121207/25082_1 /TAXON_ID=35127 /ORGANISM="Thalassiosira sp., Strain NH16" /LENGTH=321 /DNA_ID=CAMNT_0023206945 /DNA_START=21 /DNA_END=986 /DNA_ORIENTATION=+
MIGRLMLSPATRRTASMLRLRLPSAPAATKPAVPKGHVVGRRFGDKANTTTDAAATKAQAVPPAAVKEGAASAAKTSETVAAAKASEGGSSSSASSSWWDSAEFWGRCGALAGWGMSGAAIYDALESSPELISLNMTGVLLVYSSLFSRWAFVVKPQNLLLAGCHITNVAAQANQLRRAVEYKKEHGLDEEVNDIMVKAGATAAAGAACVLAGPAVQGALVNASLGPISAVAAAEAGPFTVHFWAPMSKWCISGASFLELDRPTEKISLAQYSALTLTGLFFSRYALLVAPINYTLCSVNIALFGSSAWHLGRKVKADFLS